MPAESASPPRKSMFRFVFLSFTCRPNETRKNRARRATALAPQALINPEIMPISEKEQLGWEGCLSIPGLRAAVPRFAQIRYAGLDRRGNRVEREASGLHAVIVQHENDHLDGILYPMRMTDFSLMGFNEELARFQPALPPVGS